ncbi:MAG: hypothetical protein ABIK65_08440 [Candidatus Eisenbacteria bacterium]
MSPLFRSVWIAFRRSGGLPFLLVLLAGVGLLFFAALRAEGNLVVNGRPVALEDGTLVDFSLGFGLRAVSFVVVLFLLFQGTGLVLRDGERGSAVFDLTAPVSRGTYLAARGIGLLSILVVIWAVAIAGFEAALLARFGFVRPALASGALVFLLAHVLFAAMLVLFRLYLGAGWGAMAGVLVLVASGVLSFDLVESYLFDVPVPREGGAWWLPFLMPYLQGEPVGLAAALARGASRYGPPIGNVLSVGLDVALGKPVFPRFDAASLPVAAVWTALFAGGAHFIFRRRDH